MLPGKFTFIGNYQNKYYEWLSAQLFSQCIKPCHKFQCTMFLFNRPMKGGVHVCVCSSNRPQTCCGDKPPDNICAVTELSTNSRARYSNSHSLSGRKLLFSRLVCLISLKCACTAICTSGESTTYPPYPCYNWPITDPAYIVKSLLYPGSRRAWKSPSSKKRSPPGNPNLSQPLSLPLKRLWGLII